MKQRDSRVHSHFLLFYSQKLIAQQHSRRNNNNKRKEVTFYISFVYTKTITMAIIITASPCVTAAAVFTGHFTFANSRSSTEQSECVICVTSVVING